MDNTDPTLRALAIRAHRGECKRPLILTIRAGDDLSGILISYSAYTAFMKERFDLPASDCEPGDFLYLNLVVDPTTNGACPWTVRTSAVTAWKLKAA